MEGVAIETADPRVRAARLRRLPAEGFVPPHAAAPDAAFAADVRAFAASFWALPPADRRARWHELSGRLVGPAAARLADLAPGLGVAPVAQPDPRAAELADLVRELFVLPPHERAARRVAWLTAADLRDAKWAAASRTVLRSDLPLARLEERLFDWFSLCDQPAAVPAVAESAAWVRRPGRPVSEPVPRPARAAAAGGLGCMSGPGAVVVVLIVVVRIVIALSGPSRPPAPTYSPPPAFKPMETWPVPTYVPDVKPWQPPGAVPTAYRPSGAVPTGIRRRLANGALGPDFLFTPAQITEFREYQERMLAGRLRPGERPPPQYALWEALGRPMPDTAP